MMIAQLSLIKGTEFASQTYVEYEITTPMTPSTTTTSSPTSTLHMPI